MYTDLISRKYACLKLTVIVLSAIKIMDLTKSETTWKIVCITLDEQIETHTMKKTTKHFLIIGLITLCLEFQNVNGFAQSMKIDWAVKDSSHNYSLGLLCDKDSNVCSYGSYSEYDTQGDLKTAGSFLEKFSTRGNLILMKKWPVTSFSIQKIIYDGSQYFYFSGFFSESCVVDGISISCKGNKDGMIGKMNSGGTILWITTFGSSKDEMGYGLCFGPSNNSLILAGSTTDSLAVNNVFVDKGQQSMLIAQFSLSGALQNHKFHDFFPQRDGGYKIENAGREIYSATNGNYFVLADRQGSRLPSYPDTITGTREGSYVMKLNPGFDTLWTQYIVGPSDYGSGAGPLKISAAGDPYVVSGVSGHYGATVNIQRLDQNSGVFTWNEIHNDGGFSDIFLDGNTLFTCGTDSATYCPCPSSDYGYQDIKTFAQNNIMTDMLKFDGPANVNSPIFFQNITRDGYGNTFVRGNFYFQYLVLGSDTIQADTTNNNGYYGNFLLKLNDKIAAGIPPLISENNNLLTVFPNPSTGKINVQMNGLTNVPMQIYNIYGECIYHQICTSAYPKIDLSSQPKGIYFLEIVSGRERAMKKIVLE